MVPDCPICKTNKYMVRAYDNATHAGGIDEEGRYCVSYSDRRLLCICYICKKEAQLQRLL